MILLMNILKKKLFNLLSNLVLQVLFLLLKIMDKYLEEDPTKNVGSRTRKNKNLYQEINDDDLENINLASNAHVSNFF